MFGNPIFFRIYFAALKKKKLIIKITVKPFKQFQMHIFKK